MNRTRLPKDVVEKTEEYINERLMDAGELTTLEIANTARVVDRSERQVQRMVAAIAEELGIATARRRLVREPEYGSLDAFLNGQPFAFDSELRIVAAAYAGNMAALHRDALRHSPEPSRLISYRQLVEKYRLEVPNDVRKLFKHGIKGFKDTSMYVRWSAAKRNEVWQIDATVLDIWIRPRGTNTLVRPNLLLIVDDHTRVILSAVLMLHAYTAEDSAAAVHRAIRTRTVTLPDGREVRVGGLPGKILCDNALQFTGEVMTTVAIDLAFMMWAVAVYSGEQKGKVERAIRDVNEQLCMGLPGYANPNRKTLELDDQLRGAATDALDEDAFMAEVAKWVEWKNNQPHPDHRTKTRLEVWADSDAPLKEADPDLLRIATLIVGSKPYTLHKDGFRITRNGKETRYIAKELAGRVGDRFTLRHLPGDPDWVDAYDEDGRFAGRCWDCELLSGKERGQITEARTERYRAAASEISAAVELRAIAAANPTDVGASALVEAHAQAIAPAADDLIRDSIGLGSHSGGPPAADDTDVVDVDPIDDDEIHTLAIEAVAAVAAAAATVTEDPEAVSR